MSKRIHLSQNIRSNLVASVLLAVAPACGDDSAESADAGAATTTADETGAGATDSPTSEGSGDETGVDETGADETGGESSGGEAGAPLVLSGFDLPESVFWSADERVWYVSNIGGELGAKDGDGFISRLDADGGVVAMDWVTGLDGPAGLRGAGGKLYVADVDRLHAIDIAGAAIEQSVTIPGAMFLNDVEVGPGGEVFVSDTVTHSVHMWQPGSEPVVVIQSPGLEAPNGLIFKGDALYVAGIGSLSDANLVGHLQRIDMGAATPISDHAGKFDGLEVDGADFLATEFTGKLERISGDGATVTVVRDLAAEDGLMSTADLGFDPDRRLVAIPDLLGGNVALYTLPDAG